MEEKKQIKMSLGTSICIFIIILLVIALAGMYLYFNKEGKNNVNGIVKVNSKVGMQEKEEKDLYKVSDFELINNSLIDAKYNNLKSFITSKNEIEEIVVNGITIYTEEYLKVIGNTSSLDIKENEIAGSCVFTIKFKDIEGLALAGSKGDPHGEVGNCLVDQKEFVFDKTTNRIELCTGLLWKEESKTNVEVNNNPVNDNVETKNNQSETINKLSKEDTYFVIKDIKEKENKYEITAYILEQESRRFSEEEYNKILNGGKFTFRGSEWKLKEMEGNKGYDSSAMKVASGDKMLYVLYDAETKDFYIENIAGVKTGGLEDYSSKMIKFEVDKDIYVGNYWTTFRNDSGKIKMEGVGNEEGKASIIKELIEWTSDNNVSGSYEECKATVIDGKIAAIQMFYK